MPVDPLEEARERLEFKSPFRNDMTVSVLDVLTALESWARSPRLGGSHSFTYGELEIGARMARDALVELDRRSPPTREGAWVLVPREPSEEQLAPYRGLNRTRDTRTIAARIYRDMLAAAPLPLGVSRRKE